MGRTSAFSAGTSTFVGGIIANHLQTTKALTIQGAGTSTFTGGITAGGLSSSEGLTITSGSLSLNLESFNDLTGTGLTNQGGALTLGTLDAHSDVAAITEGTGDIIYFDGANWNDLNAGTKGEILSVTTGGIPGWISTSTFAHLSDNNAFTGANIFSGLNSFTNTGTTTFKGGIDIYDSLAIGRTVGTTTILGPRLCSVSMVSGCSSP